MINKTPIAAALLAISTVTASGGALAGEMEDRIAALEAATSAALKAEVDANKEEIVVNKEEIEEARPIQEGHQVPVRRLHPVGRQWPPVTVKASPASSTIIEDLLVPSLIPVEPAAGRQGAIPMSPPTCTPSRRASSSPQQPIPMPARFHPASNWTLSCPATSGDERISNSWNSRLRHAFVKWDYSDKQFAAGRPDLVDLLQRGCTAGPDRLRRSRRYDIQPPADDSLDHGRPAVGHRKPGNTPQPGCRQSA